VTFVTHDSLPRRSAPHSQRLPGTQDLLCLHRRWPTQFPHLLQSAVEDRAQHPQARYDILFAFPAEVLQLGHDGILNDNGTIVAESDFLTTLDRQWAHLADEHACASDIPFCGGWFLYLGYELVQQIEPRLVLPRAEDDFPLAVATRIPAAIINDHHRGETILVAESASLLRQLQDHLQRSLESQPSPAHVPHKVVMREDDAAIYLRQVERVRQYIIDGDVFQVNLSRVWQGERPDDMAAADLYQSLCESNPAPFAALVSFAQGSVVSSSPERLLRVRNTLIETRPIAGTRPRSAKQDDDAAYKAELIAHPKERAEHVMLIDLERNDLGRICEPGSIQVDEMMVLESYAHVHHIVSSVKGTLRTATTPGEVIRAVFPGGTITGCPKERCMAIIAELEQCARGPYTGSVGYLNHNGDMDLNILIRTIKMTPQQISLRAGAGLIYDSVAQNELQETRHKARGMLLALGALE